MTASTRRAALGALLAAPLASVPSVARSEVDLLRLGQQFDAAWLAEREAVARCEGDCSMTADRVLEAAFETTRIVVQKIEALPATTLAGLVVKARAVSWCHCGEAFNDESFSDRGTTDVRLAAGVLRDLLTIGGGTCA